MPALLFGSISTVTDTSEIQRAAFNEAFRTHGLDWKWERDEYRDLLTSNGGVDRIAEYARQRNETVDAAAVHDTKSKLFQDMVPVRRWLRGPASSTRSTRHARTAGRWRG